MAALSAPPSAHRLTLVADGEAGLHRAIDLHPESRTPAALARLREQLVMIINAVVAEEPDRNAERAIAQVLRGFRLGFSAIMEARERQGKSADDGVHEYVRERKLDRVYATGNKIWAEQVHKPLEELVKANQLPEEFGNDAVLSQIIVRSQLDFHFQDPVRFATEEFRRIMRGEIRSMQDVRAFTAELDDLRSLLALAPKIGIDQQAIRRALEPGIESGLRSMKELTEEHLFGYLEIGVLAKAHSARHGVRRVTPLTFPATEAKRFFQDFDHHKEKDSATMKPEALAAYQEACDGAFAPEDREIAKKVVRYTLAAIESAVNMHMYGVRDCPSPEYFFPVHRFSPEVLDPKPPRRRKKS